MAPARPGSPWLPVRLASCPTRPEQASAGDPVEGDSDLRDAKWLAPERSEGNLGVDRQAFLRPGQVRLQKTIWAQPAWQGPEDDGSWLLFDALLAKDYSVGWRRRWRVKARRLLRRDGRRGRGGGDQRAIGWHGRRLVGGGTVVAQAVTTRSERNDRAKPLMLARRLSNGVV